MSLLVYRKFVSDSLIVGLGNISSQAVSLLLIPLVIKLASPAVFGAYVLISSVLVLSSLLFSLGLGFHYRRSLPSSVTPAERAAVFFPGVLAQTVSVLGGSLLLYLAFPLFGERLLGGHFEFNLLLIPAFCMASVLCNQAGEYFRYTHRMALYSGISIVASVLNIAIYLACGLGGAGMNLNILFGAQVVSLLITGGLLWWMILREIPLTLRWPKWGELRHDFRLGFPLTAAVFADTASAASDRYLIAGFLTAAAVGFYAPAASLGALILFLPRISNMVLVPLLARGRDTAQERTNDNLVHYSVRMFLLIAVPAFAGMVIVAEPALVLLANAEVAAAGRLVVPVLTAASVVYGLTWILQSVLFVERRTSVTLVSNLTAGLIKVGLGLVALIAGAGLVGVAVATLLAQVAGLIVVLRDPAIRKDAVLDYVFLAKIAAASTAMAVVIKLAESGLSTLMGATPLLAAVVVAGVLFYGFGLLLLRVFSAAEIGFFREHLGGVFSRPGARSN